MPHCLWCKKGIFFRQLFLAELYARANRPPSLRKFGNLSIRENLVMTSLYAHPSARTCTSPRLVFGAKLTILWATNGAARVKISMEVSCVRLTRKFSEIKFWSFAFCRVTLLVTLRENPTPPPPRPPARSKFWQMKSCEKTMQYLQSCLPTHLRTMEAYFHFS